ncbi:MAG: DUF2868 domain-containing protein [Pseudomonadota bacterium]|nr:DUF2868 domain-containing protein [Pseudomonadota bacterium]
MARLYRNSLLSRYNEFMTHSSLIGDLIDLNSALKSDRSTDSDEKKQRDRAIGQALQQQRSSPDKQVRGWLDQVSIGAWKRDGYHAVQLYHVLCVMLVFTGLATGWGLARAVLYYTGDAPINIVNALGLLVLLQILLLLLWLLSTIPNRIPLFGSLQSALRFLNPGRLVRHLARLFPAQSRQSLSLVWDAEYAPALAPATRWLFSFWSQLFSFCFNIGVLLAAFYTISFSDLAFAWSTTLNLDSTTFHHMLSTLSWPWHTLFPHAVPSPELVEISRYYRLEEGSLGDAAAASELAAQLGQWWPFLVTAIICYGLIPRLLTLLISWWRFRHHLAHALPRLPGAPELLARMNSPLISTSALQPETVAEIEAGAGYGPSESGSYGLKCAVIDWSGTGVNPESIAKQLQTVGISSQDFLMAGGTRTTDQDNASIVSLCNLKPEGVAVIVKSWEPPLLEFLDFVHSIREQCNGQQPIIILLWGGRDGVAGRDRETWQLTLRQLKDPDLHIEAMGPVQ